MGMAVMVAPPEWLDRELVAWLCAGQLAESRNTLISRSVRSR